MVAILIDVLKAITVSGAAGMLAREVWSTVRLARAQMRAREALAHNSAVRIRLADRLQEANAASPDELRAAVDEVMSEIRKLDPEDAKVLVGSIETVSDDAKVRFAKRLVKLASDRPMSPA